MNNRPLENNPSAMMGNYHKLYADRRAVADEELRARLQACQSAGYLKAAAEVQRELNHREGETK